jgi:hypothetical protein
MADEALGTSIKAFCGRCGGERNCEVKGIHSEGGSEADGAYDWSTRWYLLVCRGCDFPFAQSVSTDSESYYDYSDHNGDHAREYFETVETWPAKAKRKTPDWFEHHRVEGTRSKAITLNAALSELYRALNADLMVLASIGIRTAFDAASEVLGIEPGLPFEAKLNSLLSEGKIRASEKDTLNVLVDAGSAAAHRGWQPDAEQLDVQMDILEEFIFNSLVLPARAKTKADKVEKLRQAVPPKTKSKKRAALMDYQG